MKPEAKGRFSLPKETHIRRPEEFEAVKEAGVRVRAGDLAMGFLAGSSRRLGIAASKAVGSAVVRNRLKRVIREFFRLNRELFPKGDCVVIPGRRCGKLKNEELRRQMARALEKLADSVR